MGKHTPGPWTFRLSDHDEGCYYEVMGPWLNGARAWVGGAEMTDDARLIAAAPDLLEALLLCESLCEPGNALHKQVQAAIAKATETPPCPTP